MFPRSFFTSPRETASGAAGPVRPGARARRVGIAAVVASLALTAPCEGQAADAALAEGIMLNLVSLSSARLAAAKSSAQWQWQHRRNVTRDHEADDVLLAGLNTVAPHYGLDPVFARTFFNDQNRAAEQLQAALLAAWKTGPTPARIDPSAFEAARGETYRISQGMLPALVRVVPLRTREDCPILLSHALSRWTTQMARLDAPEKAALQEALKNVCTAGGIGGTA